mgnify:CR=1 FL=1
MLLADRRWNMTIDGEHAREFDESAELWVKSRQQTELVRDQTTQGTFSLQRKGFNMGGCVNVQGRGCLHDNQQS